MPAKSNEPNGLDYHRAFRERAKSTLPHHQYRALHQSAMAAAGGYASSHARRVDSEAAQGRAVRARTDRVGDVIKAAFAAPQTPTTDDVAVQMPILTASGQRQILFCVGLEPGTVDTQGDVMDADEIEMTAHQFMAESRKIHQMHDSPIDAVPVESYIAPQELLFENGPNGEQVVKQGSWVLGIHVRDPEQWAKVQRGEYTGISVGGFGLRIPVHDDDG